MQRTIRPDLPILRRAAASVATGLMLAALAGCAAAPPPDPAEVVAVVDGTPITRGEVGALIDVEQSRNPDAGVTDAIRRGALETLIGTELMYEAALARGMAVPPERVAEELVGVRSQFAKDEEFAAYLANNGLTEALIEQRAVRRLLVADYARLVVDEAAPDETALREAFEARRETFVEPESLRARQVLVQVKRKGDSVENNKIARETAEQGRRRLLAGESFDTVAAELSTGPNSQRGGELDWFRRGRWMRGFDAVVFDTPVGELTEVFRTPIGYHVVKVLERRASRPQTFEEVRNALTLSLTRERRDTALEEHVRELLDTAQVEIHDDDLRRAMETAAD